MKRTYTYKILFFILAPLFCLVVNTQAQVITDYSALPPFLGPEVPPNILLLVDNSGSMNRCAYADTGDLACADDTGNPSIEYVSTTKYSGYFQEDKCYTYASDTFSPNGNRPCVNKWDGNFLNWVTMRRIDLTKWVMTGGLCNTTRTDAKTCTTLRGQNVFSGGCCYRYFKEFDLTGLAPTTHNGTKCLRVRDGNFYLRNNCDNAGGTTFRIQVGGVVKQTGVIQDIGERARFGLMHFDDDGNVHNGGEIASDIGADQLDLVKAVEAFTASTWTPLSESLYEAARYFAQIPPEYEADDYTVNVNNDPYCFSGLIPPSGETGCINATQGRWVPCCQSFVLLFTDGAATQDTDIPTAIQDYAHDAESGNHGNSTHCAGTAGCTADHLSAAHPNNHGAAGNHNDMNEHHDNCSGYFGGTLNDSCRANGSHYLDDVAFWAHTVDLRPNGNITAIGDAGNTNDLDGKQSITLYPFFAFGSGGQLMKDAAKLGGFEDHNGDGHPGPDTSEWDKNNDGIPDTYFESTDAFSLRTNLVAAITDILQRSASGTSVSVLASSSGGEGAVYQAYFFPSKDDGLGTGGEVAWLGFLQGLFFDAEGQLREDTVQDGRLILQDDKIVETFFDLSTLETRVRRFDVDAEGKKTSSSTVIDLDELKPTWEAGKILAKRDLDTAPRRIKTWVDLDADGSVDSGEYIDFSTGNEAILRPYLRAANTAEGKDIIDFIHGRPISTMRPRELDVDGVRSTWRLGDIIYSSPVSVGAPAEAYDMKYEDASFTPFFDKYKNRRNVVYVGANDGMLHAFNAGYFHQGDDLSSPKKENGYFTTMPTGSGGTPLGEELWSFIPQELLPHLKWLTGTDYDKGKHIYFVDGSPRIASLQIFTEEGICASDWSDASCIHPKGWGTVLIGSMRLGGGLIKVDVDGNGDDGGNDIDGDAKGDDRFRSAYFALDITDPESEPELLWVYTDKDLGFTSSWPAIARFDKDTWHAVIGSGPLSYTGQRDPASSRNKFSSGATNLGQIYSIDLKTGLEKYKSDVGTDTMAFMGDPAIFDMPKNYVTDIVYIGKNYETASGWSGKVHRLLTYGGKDTTNWKISELFDAQKPVLVKPTASIDGQGRFWVYFGSGRLFSAGPASDQTDTSPQTLYGMRESSSNGCWDVSTGNWKLACPTISSVDLLDSTNIVVKKDGSITGCSACSPTQDTVKELVNEVMNGPTPLTGWFIDLMTGERVLHESSILGGILTVTTHTPGVQICVPQGTNAIFAVNFETGVAYPSIDLVTGYAVGVLGLESDNVTLTRRKALGQGVASKVNVVVSGSTVTAFVQSSTGEIVQIKNLALQYDTRQGTRIFQEKSE